MTKNFKIQEFECKCGCDMPADVHVNIVKLAQQLQVIRDVIDKPIQVTNAYRCASHNKKIGGVPNSQHVQGKAADLKVKGLSPKHVSNLIDDMASKGEVLQGGIGIYPTFTHYDIRKTKARWDYR